MRDYINIYKVRARLLLMLATVLLAACSDDSDRVDGETDVLQLVAYSQGMTDLELMKTRGIPSGYDEYTGPNSIGVYTTSADEAPSSIRTFSYVIDQWKSLVNVKNHETYYIYGYMPASSDINCIISKREGMDYTYGAVLTFSELPPVLAEDFCVVTGVQQLDNKTDEVNLTPGVFTFTGKQTGSNFACLMLDHLYSCVCFRFLVKDTYNELRTIKLKKVEMKSLQAISYPLTVTMKQTMNKDEAYSVSWGECTSYSSNKYVPLFISVNGEEPVLSDTEAQEVNGYFAPVVDEQDPSESVYNNLELRCTYDVYDKKGNLTRQNCEAVNRLPALTAGRNKRTVLTLTVNPTYLYVLSDPDLDNPTITIN